MSYRCMAFDMDGTLLDTMRYWRQALPELAVSHGFTTLTDDEIETIMHMSCYEALEWLSARYPDSPFPAMTVAEVEAQMEWHYRNDATVCDGAAEYVRACKEKGIPLCIISATSRYLIELALDRVGLLSYFDFILTPEEFPHGKSDPAIFREAARRFGVSPHEMALVDDAYYSLQTAASIGVYCIGTADVTQENDRDAIRALCQEYYAETLGVK